MTIRRQRIIHIMHSMKIGGAERAIYQLIKAQREAGCIADLGIITKKSLYGEKVEALGSRVYCLEKSANKLLIFSKLTRCYDIVHFHSALPLYFFIAALGSKGRLFYTHRGGNIRYQGKKLINFKVAGLIVKLFFHGISGNTRHAATVAARVFHIPSPKVRVTYNGIDVSLLVPSKTRQEILGDLDDYENNTIRIGTTARIRKLKRIDMAIKAVAALGNLPLKFYIVGDGPDKGELQQMCKRMRLDGKVIFVGKKKNVADYLQIFDIFVMLSDQSESFGNSVVEALGFGIPSIIMADGGGMIEHICNDGGVIAHDQVDLTSCIQRLSINSEMRKKMGEKGKKFVTRKYTLANMVDGYQHLYSA